VVDVNVQQGVEVEVIDPRTIVPLDMETILTSVEKTGRLVVVDEANLRCSIASEIGISVAEQAFSSLKAAIIRVARPDVRFPLAHLSKITSPLTSIKLSKPSKRSPLDRSAQFT